MTSSQPSSGATSDSWLPAVELQGLADLLAGAVDGQHEAGADEASVACDAAGSAVTGRAAFLGTGQPEWTAQDIEHGVIRLAQEVDRLAVDGG